MQASTLPDWYETWFNSPYYHVLYRHRNQSEARAFIDNLLKMLKPEPGSRILDLACGRGRHSAYLCTMDFVVTGIDLSPANIAAAKMIQSNSLYFEVHDMREPFSDGYFNYVFNFFTSFGYFDEDADNVRTVQSAAKALKKGGTFVLDFMNAHKVIGKEMHQEVREVDGIQFHISRTFRDGFIYKDISFNDKGLDHRFTERVQALQLADFERYFTQAKLKLTKTYGSYALDPFDPETSDRLILIAVK